MARPVVYEDLVAVSASVPSSLKKEAIAEGLNISEVLREALAERLASPGASHEMRKALKKFKGVSRSRLAKAVRKISEFPGRAPGEVRALNNDFNISAGVEDLLSLVPRV